MHGERFDTVARALAKTRSRRVVLAAISGVAAGTIFASSTEAARRGFSGPRFLSPVVPSDHCPVGTDCQDGICCQQGGTICAGSGVSCSTNANCVSDEICHEGQCWLACNPPG
jgi:hypothetical protein